MELFGLQFAPLNIPLERRLQTLAAGVWFITMVFGGLICSIASIYILLYTSYWWIMLGYLLWFIFLDNKTCEEGGRRSEWVRSWACWRYFKNYFPLRLERVAWADLDRNKNYLFCCFPHGMLCTGPFSAFGSIYGGFEQLYPYHRTYVMTLGQHFLMPIFRELVLGLGGMKASAKAIDNVLSKEGGGNVAVLMVGGASEAFYCRPGQYKIIYSKRKGFVKLAMKNGTSLVPVISFGETDLFDQLANPEGSRLRNLQEWLKKYIGIAPAVPMGRGFFQYSFGMVPQRRPVTTVVGKPMEVAKNASPTRDEIDAVHEAFKQKLIELFEEQKHNYLSNPEGTKLEIM